MEALDTAIAVGIFSLAGALVGALASTVGPFLLQAHQRKLDAETRKHDERGTAVKNLVNAWVEFASRSTPVRDAAIVIKANNAMTDMLIIIPREQQRVADYVSGVLQAISAEADVARRVPIANYGGRNLVEWHRGVLGNEDLIPFRFIGTAENGDYLVEDLGSWS